jgi:hypothetical protein
MVLYLHSSIHPHGMLNLSTETTLKFQLLYVVVVTKEPSCCQEQVLLPVYDDFFLTVIRNVVPQK